MIKKMVKNKNGQAMVEMALITPILVLLLFSIIEFGWIFGAQLLVTHSSREGARYGAVHSTETGVEGAITSRVQAAASALDAGLLNININFTAANHKSGDVEVRVTYPVTVVTPVVSAITGSPVNVTSQCVMRVE